MIQCNFSIFFVLYHSDKQNMEQNNYTEGEVTSQ